MIILGLGSNLSSSFGNRFKNIDLAIENLCKQNIKLVKKSSFYETPSYPNKNNPKFINVVIQVLSNLKPEELASLIMETEKKIERKRLKKNDPRTCDIDILDFNSKNMNFKYLNYKFTVPHIKLTLRNFVLFPLQEILPNWIHPKTNMHINVLLDNLSYEEKNSILKVKNF
jgi:2-amino-4-hydroxy-6-hydroxymethyldihydropteridine diphosphokinase